MTKRPTMHGSRRLSHAALLAALLAVLTLVALLLTAPMGMAAWPSGGVKVNTSTGADSSAPRIAVDDSGNSLVVWQEDDGRIYADKVASDGTLVWGSQLAVSGLGVSTSPRLALDAAGDAVVCWQASDGKVYANKVESNGTLPWASAVAISSGADTATSPRVAVASDSSSTIVWQETGGGVYARRLGADGVPSAGQVRLSSPTRTGTDPDVTGTRTGEAYVAWEESDHLIYVNKFAADGSLPWASPVHLDSDGHPNHDPRVTTDPAGSIGAYVVWVSERDSLNTDICAASLSPSGAVDFNEAVDWHDAYDARPSDPMICYDGEGGMIAVWVKMNRVFGERLDSEGNYLWGGRVPGFGIYIGGAAATQPSVTSFKDGEGLVVWLENGTDVLFNYVGQSGSKPIDPIQITPFEEAQASAPLIASSVDGTYRGITWAQVRQGEDRDVYAGWLSQAAVTQVSPDSANIGSSGVALHIEGLALGLSTSASLEMDGEKIPVVLDSVEDRVVEGHLDVPAGTTPGQWTLWIQRQGVKAGSYTPFYMQAPAPNPTSMEPGRSRQLTTLRGVKIHGTDFRNCPQGIRVELENSGTWYPIEGTSVEWHSPTLITADFVIDCPMFATWNLRVTHEDDQTYMVLHDCFTVDPFTNYGWKSIGSLSPPAPVVGVEWDSRRGSLYAVAGQVYCNADPMGSGVWKTLGKTSAWADALELDQEGGILYAGDYSSKIYRWNPALPAPGWESLGGPSGGDGCNDILLDAGKNRLFVSCGDGDVYVRNNPSGDGRWTKLARPPDVINGLAVDPGTGVLFGASSGGSVYKYSGAPGAWTGTGGKICEAGYVSGLQFDETRDILYASACDGYVYMRERPSGPGNWSSLGTFIEIRNGEALGMALDSRNDILYVATRYGHVCKNISPSSGSTSWIDTGMVEPWYCGWSLAFGNGKNSLFAGTYGDSASGPPSSTMLPSTRNATPASGALGSKDLDVVVDCVATDVRAHPVAHFSGLGIKVNSTERNSATSVTANVTIEPGASLGGRDVWITYQDRFGQVDKTTRLEGGFEVTRPSWYLAEGSNAWGYSTYISLENPNNEIVRARLTYLLPNAGPGAGVLASRDISLPARSQTTVSSTEDIGEVDFSTVVECLETKRIAADRTMFWNGENATAPGYHASIGSEHVARTWYLPEGSSAWGFETWTAVLNPGGSEANVTMTYMTGDGPVVREKKVPANSRVTWSMASDIGQTDASIRIESDRPVVAERSMYRNGRREGSCSIGAIAPAKDFFLAEGAVGHGSNFTTYVMVQNPGAVANDVSLTFQTGDGTVAGPKFTMQPNTRKTVRLNDCLPQGTDVSTLVHGSRPLVAERAVYWDSSAGQAFHASIGLTAPHRCFMFPDGQSSNGFETWTLVANPNPAPVRVRVGYLPQGGGVGFFLEDEIPPGTRRSYSMEDLVKSGRAAIMVEAVDGARPVIVERAMFTNGRTAGTDTIGSFSDWR